MFGWFKRKAAPAPVASKLEEGDKAFDAANFVLFWISAIRREGFETGNPDLDAFRTWLLAYTASAHFAGQISDVDPIGVATSVASGLFPGGGGPEVADIVVRMSDNWQRLHAAHPAALQAYCDALQGMLRHPSAGAIMQMSSAARTPQEHALVVKSVPDDLPRPAIQAFNALVDEANAARFPWA